MALRISLLAAALVAAACVATPRSAPRSRTAAQIRTPEAQGPKPDDAAPAPQAEADSPVQLKEPAEAPPASAPAPEPFTATVRPILVERCSPCHEKGGRMYERMPFDDPATIRSHPDGVKRRLEGKDLETVVAWIEGRVR